MRKNPFLLFILITIVAVVAAISLIQSRRFADFTKGAITRFLPKELGVAGDFSHFELQFFPPGVAISNPSLQVTGENAAGLPPGTTLTAKRLELSFRALQALSGKIRIHEVRIVEGNLKTALVASAPKVVKPKSTLRISWQDLFQIRAEKLTLVDTAVDLSIPSQDIVALFIAKEVTLFQTKREGEQVPRTATSVDTYQLDLDVADLKLSHKYDLPFPTEADRIRLSAQIDAGGVFLKQFRLDKEDTYIDFAGKVTGDVLKAAGLKFAGELRMKGNLETVLDSLDDDERPTGVFEFEGKVASENLERWQKNGSASGKLRGKNLKWKTIEVDDLDTEGSFDAATKELKVVRAVARTNPRARRGPLTLGSGGIVRVGAFETKMGSAAPIKVTIETERAHLNWLFSPIIKNFFVLDGNVTGKADLVVTPPQGDDSFAIEGNVDWTIDALTLDNQKYGVKRELSKIFVIPNVRIRGGVQVSDEDIQFRQMKATLRETDFIVDGSVRFGEDSSFELRGGGPIDLSEIRELVGLPAKGKGQLSIYVHGTSDDVVLDFDGDVRDFEFIHLKFGDFRGRISFLEKESRLRLQKLDCNKGSTRYSIDGFFDFADKARMELDAAVPSGDLHEFLSIFDDITHDYWWFPNALGGSFHGDISLRGGVSLPDMQIRAKIAGQSWDFYSERLKEGSFEFGYDKGKYSISNFRGVKKRGLILADLTFSEREGMNWKASTSDMLLTDFDHLSRLRVPLRGSLAFTSEGKGKFPMIVSKTDLMMSDTVFRGLDYPRSELKILTDGGRANVTGNLFGSQAQVASTYDFTDGRPSSVQLSANSFDFSPALLVLNPNLVRDPGLEGKISGGYSLNFITGAPELGSGRLDLRSYVLKKADTKFHLEKPVVATIDRGTFDLASVTLVGDEGRLGLALRSQSGQVVGRLRGNIDLGILEFFTSTIESAEGLLGLDVRFGGTLREPRSAGDGEITNGVVHIASLETPLESIRGNWNLKDGLFTIGSLGADFAAGKMTAGGSVLLGTQGVPKLDLTIGLTDNRMKVYPFQFVKTNGTLKVQGDALPYAITGNLVIDSGLSREKIANNRGPGFRASRYAPEEGTTSDLDRPMFTLGIDVSAPGKLMIQNELMDLEAKASVRIVNTLDLPRIVGTAQAVQGKILFKDRAFQIQSGTVDFDSPTVMNPRFEMIAQTEIENRKIQMYASGRLGDETRKLEFTANPPMRENEILTLLALGVTNDDVRGVNAVDRSTYQQGEAASLVLHSLDFNREVKNKTGFQIGVDQAVDSAIGQSIFRPRALDQEPTATPKVVIRRDFGKRFGVLAGSTVGVGTNVQREFNAEMRVTPGFSVLGVWDTYEGTNSDESRRNSYGFDLKLQKRFK